MHREPTISGQRKFDATPIGEIERPSVHRVPQCLIDIAYIIRIRVKSIVPRDGQPTEQKDVGYHKPPNKQTRCLW